MKPDLSGRADIETVIELFYEKVKTDDCIGCYFTEVVTIDWEKHLQQMCAFWENILFYMGEYEGNALRTHQHIHRLYPTTPRHFKRWLQLFDGTVDACFEGSNARKMKQHAHAIAKVMQQHI